MILFNLISIEPIFGIGILLMFGGFALLFINARLIIRAKSSENWDKTKGLIISSELVDLNFSGDTSHSYKPKIKYSYSIEGKDYISKRVYFGSNVMSSFKKHKSQRIVDKYPVNMETTVYYNQSNPRLCVLMPGIKSELITGLMLGLIFLGLGYVFVTYPDFISQIGNK